MDRVTQSELPFRMLCRAHGATAAYTPMLHARLFAEVEKYRAEHFTTTSSAVDRSGDRFAILLQTGLVRVDEQLHVLTAHKRASAAGAAVGAHQWQMLIPYILANVDVLRKA